MDLNLLAEIFECDREKISLQPLAGDASLRRYYRLSLQKASWIIAEYPPERFAEQARIYDAVHRILRNAWIRVPTVLARYDEYHFFVLEDLGNTLLADLFVQNDPSLPEMYRRALSLIRSLQELTYDRSLSSEYPYLFDRALNGEKLRAELHFFTTHFVKGYVCQKLSSEAGKSLDASLDFLIEEIVRLPTALAHRDFHSRNLMIKKGELVVIDFQDLQMGPHLYDLCSLLFDPYVPITSQFRQELQILDGIDPYSLAIVGIQRLLKACGTYASQWLLHQRAYYLPYLRTALERASELSSSHEKLLPLHQWIAQWRELQK